MLTTLKQFNTIKERFDEFDRLNPNIFTQLRNLSFYLRNSVGIRKCGIALLFERLRWDHTIKTAGREGFKLSNDFRAHYARKLMNTYPMTLTGFFNTKRLRSE